MAVDPKDVEEAFRYFDSTDSGSLDLATFSKLARSLGQTPSNEEIAQIAGGADAIDVAKAKDFINQMVPATQQRDSGKILEAFKAFDPENTGKIKYDEFKCEILDKGAEPISPAEKTAILANVEASGARAECDDGLMDYKVYAAWISKQLNK